MTNSKSKISYLKLPSDDPKQRQPDISKANDWEPEIELREGLVKTIRYFESKINNYN